MCFGGSGPVAKPLIEAGFDSLEVAWLRLAGGALLLLPMLLRYRWVLRAAPKLVLAYGIFAIAGVQVSYFVAIASIPVGVALLIEFLGPVLVLGWIRFVRREAVSKSAALGIVLAVVGLVFVVQLWSGSGIDPVGLSFALVAAGCQAAYLLLSDHTRTGTAHVPPMALVSYGLVVGTLVVSVLAQPWRLDWPALLGDVTLLEQRVPAWLPVLWIVAFSTVLAYLAGVIAVRKLSPPVAGAIAFLEPVVATVLAWLLVGERLGPTQLFGGALILVGAYVAQRAAPAQRASAELAAT